MATAKKPYKLDGEAAISGRRDVHGRYARENALPDNPLDENRPASNDQQVMSGWAPGIGQGTARMTGQENPYPPVAPDAATKSKFNVS